MRLIAEIKDPKLLLEEIYEQGTCFYREVPIDGEGEEEKLGYEVVYFSGNRFLHFKGLLTKDQLDRIRQMATKVSEIEVDVKLGFVRIQQ